MTSSSNTSKFNLPTGAIAVEETPRSVPKATRLRKVTFAFSAQPSVELMAELQDLLAQLHPDDPHPRRSWKRVLIIINYETAGHPDGFTLANAWFQRGRKYKGLAAVLKFWKGMRRCSGDPLTIRTLRWMADQKSQGL